MKLPRREFLHLAAGATALPALPRVAAALDYPTRPVHIIVGFPPGGGADIVSRLISQRLSERLGQRFVVENRPGAGSNIGAEVVVRSPPDGYTLFLVTLPPNAANASLYSNLSFNFERDIAPVAGLSRDPIIMEINPSLPVKTVGEFIAYAKANPGRINMASSGIGSTQHLAGELFIAMTNVSLNHVPYRGAAPALTDLMGGQVQVFFDVATSSIEYVEAGKLRALAVTTATRWERLPELPPISDVVPGYEAANIRGLGAPRNTPMEIVDKLNKEINALLSDPAMKAQLANLGDDVLALSPSQFGKLIADETDKWAKVIKFANIKPE